MLKKRAFHRINLLALLFLVHLCGNQIREIMTPKVKAWKLFYDMKNIPDKWKGEKVFTNYYAKYCALMLVDEILNIGMLETSYFNGINYVDFEQYWQEVKQELEKI